MATQSQSIKDLVRQAYVFAGVLGESAELSGDRFQVGISYLNQIITQANLNLFLPFAQVALDLPAHNAVYILGPEDVLGSEDFQVPQSIKSWGTYALVYTESKPKLINSVGYKTGITYNEIARVGTPAMLRYSMPIGSAPEYYAYEEHADYTVLILDRKSAFPLRIVYSRCLDLTDANSMLDAPLQYYEYLMFALAYRLAVRYQQPAESIANIKIMFDTITNTIKDVVKNDNIITWNDDTCNGSGWFGNIFAPRNW